ncbi:TetR/AcrR family transcriptional regulator [Labrenzia sp. OB1]|uniref:TetR/AcrR family transcriptional regulator n=1 Tax=Labrenzia sp. OB1 TaxID=1561204 RepID=UPI0007B27F8B|nr:TetR/AcrR family transcriptional regulator [Labrenzia sp. OB1]KZM51508.1 TetR family transcriptional regulator [Labrenzia sp. OB1]
MPGLQKTKSEETRRRVLEAAASIMSELGIDSVQIREVASRAGCSVGSVYKHFDDRDELIIAVNARTLAEIRAALTEATAGETVPLIRLKLLARMYLDYAVANTNAWRGLFAHQLPDRREMPEEHRTENIRLLSLIAEALDDLVPELDENALAARTRTCFGAIHGLVSIALERRFVALGKEELHSEMEFVVERLCS